MANKNKTISNSIRTVDPYKFLRIKENPNGSITRLQHIPTTPACSDPNSSFPVLSKDVPLNPNNKTSLRLFLPKIALNLTFSSKLPIIVYFHGGGFILHQASSTMYHDFCSKLASYTTSLVVSVDYRLAPEHRLPAAFDDGMEALLWIAAASHHNKSCNNNNQVWLTKYGDFSNCLLMGSSAGGTIAYKLGLRVLTMVNDIKHIIVKGWILHYPVFGGLTYTKSELNRVNDPYLPSSVIEFMAEKSLPIGANRGHHYTNIGAGMEHGVLDRVRELGLRVLVAGGTNDACLDRQKELVNLLEENGVMVTSHFGRDDYHTVEIYNEVKCDHFLIIVKHFISSCLSSEKYVECPRFQAKL